MQQQHFFELDEPVLSIAAGQFDEAVDLLRNGQQRLQGALVADAFQLQRQAKAHVGDEGEGVRRVDRQRREHRENLRQEGLGKEFDIRLCQIGPGDDGHAFFGHQPAQLRQHALLFGHQVAGVLVDQHQLFGRGQPVGGGGGVARMGQFAQAGDADGIEFVQVRRRDRQEAQPFQQRNTGVFGLFQHAPVEAEPAQLAVVEASRACRIEVRQVGSGRQRGFEKVGLGHGALMPPQVKQVYDGARVACQ